MFTEIITSYSRAAVLSRKAADQMLKRSRSQVTVFVQMISQQTFIPYLRIKAAAMLPFCTSKISVDSS